MQTEHSDADVASLRARIQSVEDEAEIRTLYARLAQTTDARRLDDYLPLLAEDASFEIVGRTRQQGVAEIRAARQASWAAGSPPGRHTVTGIIVTLDGDRASGRAYINFISRRDGAFVLGSTGVYEDAFVKTASGWKLQSRRVTVDSA